MRYADYEAVIGLEVHAELKTESKIFCSCATSFGAEPNTHCCPICLGLPGAMPKLNRRVVELAVMAGAALNCEISELSRIDRKQYFYPDLPKAYQISQAGIPLCQNGYLDISTDEGNLRVGITRIHIEEDAGKLIHTGEHTLVDYNRCGVPLIEIVSAPDMRTGKQAAEYVRALRSILSTCAISDGRMQEGSLRCDVNISVRRPNDPGLGTRTEVKNLNSFTFIEKAIEFEFARHCALLEKGEPVVMETRRYDPVTDQTYPMRTKEHVFDYRFLHEPDLNPIALTADEIDALRESLPELPAARAERIFRDYGVRPGDAVLLTADRALADYYEAAATKTSYPRIALNLLLSDLLRFCAGDRFAAPIAAPRLADLAELLGEGVINSATAKKLLARLVESDFDVKDAVSSEGLAQIRDEAVLQQLIMEVLEAQPRAVEDYRRGKTNALRSLQGQLMSRTQGRADPVIAESLLKQALDLL